MQILLLRNTYFGPAYLETVLYHPDPWEYYVSFDVWKDAMDQRIFIAQLNIEHFRKKLLSENDGATRRHIERLLAEEEAKLADLCDPPAQDTEKDTS